MTHPSSSANPFHPSQGSPPRASFVLKPAVRDLWEQALDLLFPPVCAHCGCVGMVICEPCQAEALLTTYTVPPSHSLAGFVALGPHQGVLRSAIHALKYEQHVPVAALLGQWLGDAVQREGLTCDVVVPVPLHTRRLVDRGYNQARKIAQSLATTCQLPLLDALERHRNTQSQVELSATERRQNVRGAFRLRDQYAATLQQRSVLVIDDVCTTGSTLDACARTLLDAGAAQVLAATVCYAVMQPATGT